MKEETFPEAGIIGKTFLGQLVHVTKTCICCFGWMNLQIYRGVFGAEKYSASALKFGTLGL